MSKASERLRRRREAKGQLTEINKKRDNVVVIHYSCESFYDRPDGKSPRITSIAVRNLVTGQTESFSIHQIAERDKKLTIEDINPTLRTSDSDFRYLFLKPAWSLH